MATTVADGVFVDSNVLIYIHQAQSPFHSQAMTQLQGLAATGHPLWISRQVLREYLAVMSRPGSVTPPVSMAALANDVRSFEAQFLIAEDCSNVTAQLLLLLTAIPCTG